MATIKSIGDGLVRISGQVINAGQEIYFAMADFDQGGGIGPAPEGLLPASFQPTEYTRPGDPDPVTLIDSVSVTVTPMTQGADTLMPQIVVTKQGTNLTDFIILLHNVDDANSGQLEIYIRYH